MQKVDESSESDGGRERWRLLARRTREMTDVMLRIAADAVADFPEDVERVERVRQFLCASLAGAALSPPPTGDLLFVLGALIDAFDLDCGEPGVREAIEKEIDELLANTRAHEALASPCDHGCWCCRESAVPARGLNAGAAAKPINEGRR
jgi:hypothetical protein